MVVESSGYGELYPQTSLTEIQVGNAIPLNTCFLLKTLLSPSKILLSPSIHKSMILEPTDIFLMSLLRTSRNNDIDYH